MSRARRLSRRTVLRGLGTAIALPWLEAMVPIARAAEGPGRSAALPRRIAFLYVPNGVHMRDWTPPEAGSRFALSPTLQALEPFRDDLLVLSGLAQNNASPFGDEGGDHARSLACFLTGAHPLKTDGANIRAGVSIDQIAAGQIGQATRLPSLELGIDPSAQAGSCDSGYSCAYSSNISWKSATMPMAKEIDPRLVFDRLFGRPRGKGRPATGSSAIVTTGASSISSATMPGSSTRDWAPTTVARSTNISNRSGRSSVGSPGPTSQRRADPNPARTGRAGSPRSSASISG